MKLPQKEYFYLHELAEHWHTTMADMQYYSVHGMLEVETWLSMPGVRIKQFGDRPTNNALATSRLDDFEGYVVVEPDELRRIFRQDGTQPRILQEWLVISREERARFENAYEIECCCDRSANTANPGMHATPAVSFPGRPSVMRRITAQFEERCKQQALESSLQKEGDYLVAWAEKHIPDVQIPTAHTVRNAIRARYREHAHRTV
jgi:hypothetical protein